MKNVSKATNTPKLEWAKHLRAYGKRKFWKRTRQNGKNTTQIACNSR